MCCAVLTFTSFCEKEDGNTLNNQTEQGKKPESTTNQKALTYRSFTCAVPLPDGISGPGEKGSECGVAAVSSCNKYQACEKLNYPFIQETFSALEIERWENGEDILEDNPSFVADHYDFYLFLHNNGNGMHPDEIIFENGW